MTRTCLQQGCQRSRQQRLPQPPAAPLMSQLVMRRQMGRSSRPSARSWTLLLRLPGWWSWLVRSRAGCELRWASQVGRCRGLLGWAVARRQPCSRPCAVCSVQCAVCSVQCAVCSVQCAVCSVQCAVQADARASRWIAMQRVCTVHHLHDVAVPMAGALCSIMICTRAQQACQQGTYGRLATRHHSELTCVCAHLHTCTCRRGP